MKTILWIPILAGLALTALVGAPAHGEAENATRRGQMLFITQCRACHTTEAVNDPLKIGPNLNQLLGRKAGSVADYKYSDGMQKSNLTWTREQLDLWLQKPSGLVPGTTMTFVGLPQAGDRAALIAYLTQDMPVR